MPPKRWVTYRFFCKSAEGVRRSHGTLVTSDVTEPVERVHAMTGKRGRSGEIDVQALLLAEKSDYLRAMVSAVVEATLEVEKTAALGARRESARRGVSAIGPACRNYAGSEPVLGPAIGRTRGTVAT